MYHKYNADKDFAVTQAEDVEAKNEFLRQRDFLERTVRTLKQQVYPELVCNVLVYLCDVTKGQ